MEIWLENIQSIEKAMFQFPDVGLVQLTGNNSNGKSILIKVIAAVATLKILDQEERRALIHDKAEVGYVGIRYQGKMLMVVLHENRNKCSVTLEKTDGGKITRLFREGGLEELLSDFGFSMYYKNSICLQVHETFGVIPFVNTAKSVNYEIVDSVTTDTIAQNFLQNFKEVTHKIAKEKLRFYDEKITDLRRLQDTLVIYDYRAEYRFYERMNQLYSVLKLIDSMVLNRIRIPPKVKFLDIEIPFLLKKILFITPIPIMVSLKNISKQIMMLKETREGNCPLCGKKLDKLDNRRSAVGMESSACGRFAQESSGYNNN